jgi:hypothetical protein
VHLGLRHDLGTAAVFQLARLTALGSIVKLLFAKEQLLTGGEDKVFSAVPAFECLVLEFHVFVAAACSWARQLPSYSKSKRAPGSRPGAVHQRGVPLSHRSLRKIPES